MSRHKYIFGIASYKRANRQPMLMMLHDMGYTKDDIVVSTQTIEDYNAYKELYDEMAQIIYGEAYSVGGNKNTMMRYIIENYPGKQLVICSDKVRGVGKWMPYEKNITYYDNYFEFDALIRKAFYITNQLNGSIWGVYSVGNTMFMSHTTTINQQILGCFMGITNPSLEFLFDEKQLVKEDFEISMRYISRGHRVIRFNDLCLNATLHTKGGCHEAWNSEGDRVNRECTFRLIAMYPKLITTHPTRKNEVRYKGYSKVIKKSILE